MINPALFSFFSGSGFLDLGFENAGFDIALVNEYHQPFLNAYKHTREKMAIVEPTFGYFDKSIEAIDSSGIQLDRLINESRQKQKIVGFIGGPPCPDFSVGGKNKGSEGQNGRLTRTYIELIVKYQPDFFLFENVKGLWKTKRHREFYELMKTTLIKAGFLLTDRLTNSIEFGAPQDRDRIFLFGIKKQHIENIVSSEQLEKLFNWEKYIVHKKTKVLDKSLWPTQSPFKESSSIEYSSLIDENLKALTVQYWFDINKVEKHPNNIHCFKPKSDKFQFIPEGDDSKKSFKRLHRWRYSPTAAYGNNEVHLHPYKARRINAAEALAIQSLPSSFTLPPQMTLSDMFKTIGNGVPYLLSHAIAKTTRDFLYLHCQPKDNRVLPYETQVLK